MTIELPSSCDNSTAAPSTIADFDADPANLTPMLQPRRSTGAGIVPKIEWVDDYFDSSKYEILAVFDHNAESLHKLSRSNRRIQICCIIALVLVCAYGALVNMDWRVGRELLITLSPVMALSVLSIVLTYRSTLPHTAITSAGVLHIDKLRTAYFFPFDDIVDIAPYSNNGSTFTLTKLVSSYQDAAWLKACCCLFRVKAHVIQHLMDRELFAKATVTFQQWRRQADLQGSGDVHLVSMA